MCVPEAPGRCSWSNSPSRGSRRRGRGSWVASGGLLLGLAEHGREGRDRRREEEAPAGRDDPVGGDGQELLRLAGGAHLEDAAAAGRPVPLADDGVLAALAVGVLAVVRPRPLQELELLLDRRLVRDE